MDRIAVYPSKAHFVELAKKGNLVPVYTDLMGDFETPVSVYSKLGKSGPSFLLESIEGGDKLYQYSFIGCQPQKIIKSYWDRTEVVSQSGEMETLTTPGDPLHIIEKEMAQYDPVELEGMPPFVGGAVGMIGYEYVHSTERTVPMAENDVLGMPVTFFMITNTLVIFDHANLTIKLLVNAHFDPKDSDSIDASYEQAIQTLEQLRKTLKEGKTPAPVPIAHPESIEVPDGNFERHEFEDLVEKSKEYIHAGDIIQVVLSQRFERKFTPSPLDLYRALRTVNPSPYMFLFNADSFSLVGASPEVHVRLENRKAEIRPIAGTRPRGKTVAEDRELENDLLADEKERAEHLMLVDLARNDIGRVCEYGSINVPEYMIVERYSHVMHIVSQVEGKLADDKNAYDLMRATFPAGTVSGAPKIRAMQIISEHERDQRGPYAGALGYFSYNGNLDSCITIRTATIKDGSIYIQSGAGLVADSKPESEYQETVNKAKGMLKAVSIAEHISENPTL